MQRSAKDTEYPRTPSATTSARGSSPRSRGGTSEEDCKAIVFAQCLKAAGFSVEDIVEYRRLSDIGDETIPDRLALMQRKREDMVQQREALDKALRLLNHKIFCYERAVETGVLSWDDPNFDPNTEL